MWAAIPLANSKKFVIVNNGKILHTARNYPSAISYIKKNQKKMMKDQNQISGGESKQDKWNRGLDIFIESVIKPDPALRQCAHNQLCYHELMDVREDVLNYLKQRGGTKMEQWREATNKVIAKNL